MAIADYLGPGRSNAVPLRDLVAITKLDERDVRRRIRAERHAGVPILSDNQTGYFLPGDDWEREKCVRSLRHRARAILAVAAAIERGGA